MRNEAAPLKLRAFDLEDLSVLSSMVQDALAPAGDMIYLADEQRFLIALNRFRWEVAGDFPPYSRTHSGLRFDFVTKVERRNMPKDGRDRMLSLLSIAYHDDTVMLTFSGGAALRLTVGKLAVGLEDLGEPWPTQWRPEHRPNDAKD